MNKNVQLNYTQLDTHPRIKDEGNALHPICLYFWQVLLFFSTLSFRLHLNVVLGVVYFQSIDHCFGLL